ncbi:MAG: general secretion pathway protein GspK [Planctomycetes bacterium]|nr:general secretion pathway protein GspK [Planctomycetota bacterium]
MRLRSHQSVHHNPQRPGYVLIAVLIVVVVLSLAAYRYSDMTTAEFRASDRIKKQAQAKSLADSGIHYTTALLADKNAYSGTLGGNPFDNRGVFQSKAVGEGTGRFSIVCVDYSQDTGTGSLPLRYGVVDEASKININALIELDSSGQIALYVLMRLPGMTEEIANSMIDWIDEDDDARSGGAEMSYYLERSPSYRCKNAPLDSIEELLLVKGVTPALLFGSDLNRNGRRDSDEEASGDFSFGWAPFLTVYSRERNVDSTGVKRVNVNDRNLKTLYPQLKTAVGDELAAYVIAYRIYDVPSTPSKTPTKSGNMADLVKKVDESLNGNSSPRSRRNISSMLQLIGTSVSVAGMAKEPATVYAFPITSPENATELLPVALDKLSTVADQELPAKINVNSATKAVLTTLPGLDSADIDAIFENQPDPTDTDVSYATPAWLYTRARITSSKLIALERYVTARTQIYRIQSIGYFDRDGPIVRVEAVVDTNDAKPRIIYYRDLSDLGRSIDPRSP